MRRFLSLLSLAAVSVVVAVGADVTGKWSGSAKMVGPGGETRDTTAVMILKQTGSELTGTIGPNEDEQHTVKGKIEGDKITLEVTDGSITAKLDLALTGDRIAGNIAISNDGQSMKATIDVTRAK
jgi:hypothetical protein